MRQWTNHHWYLWCLAFVKHRLIKRKTSFMWSSICQSLPAYRRPEIFFPVLCFNVNTNMITFPLSILRDKHSSGLESVAWWICCGLPCRMDCHCPVFIWIFCMILYLYIWIVVQYTHTSARILWTCRGGPVPDWRRSDATSVGPIPARLWSAATRPLGFGNK